MPATTSLAGKKAKNGAAPASRKPSATSSSTSALMEQIATLQKALSTSSDLNPLSQLLSIAKSQAILSNAPSDPADKDKPTGKERQDAAKAVHRCVHILARSLKALCNEDRIPLANPLNAEGMLGSASKAASSEQSEAERMVADWIRQRWNEGVELLCALLNHDLLEIRSTSLELLMELQVAASASLSRLLAASPGPSSASSEGQKQAQWSLAPWRALILSLLAGPPSLSKLGNGGTETARIVARQEAVSEDVRAKFAENGMQEYDDVRFGTLREVSSILRKPSPSAARNLSLRANALSLLLLLTAIPTEQADLNNFLVEELSVPLVGSASSVKRGKKRAQANGGLKVTEDGDSDQGGGHDEEEIDMQGWFSDSGDEGGNNGSGSVHRRTGQEKQAVEGLGAAARAAGSRRRRGDISFHEGLHRLDAQKAAFSRAWSDLLLPKRIAVDADDPRPDRSKLGSGTTTALVGGELSLAATHEILVRLHAQILPHLTRPTMLHDFLVSCLDSHGATALLALNAIFTLVTRHNLDYPQFYVRLYALLDASVLHVRYRARFLRLLDVFLSSTHLAAALVASFAKRLSRLSLRAPPAAIAALLPFVWNLLKRHPRCLGMIHREWDNDRLALGPAGVSDPYDAHEPDPLKTHALDSSLWELATFGAAYTASNPRSGTQLGPAAASPAVSDRGGETHYLASLASLAKILAQPFTKDRFDLTDFLDITYATLFDTETAKTLRRVGAKARAGPATGPPVAAALPGGFGAGTGAEGGAAAYARVDVLPSAKGRERAQRARKRAEEEEEVEEQRIETERRGGEGGGQRDDEDDDERQAREAIEELKREERRKRRRVELTGTQDVCARLFNFG